MKLNTSVEDRETILKELENVRCWLFPAITAMGELIASANIDLLEDDTLVNAGYLISTLTELLDSVQETRNLVVFCSSESEA